MRPGADLSLQTIPSSAPSPGSSRNAPDQLWNRRTTIMTERPEVRQFRQVITLHQIRSWTNAEAGLHYGVMPI